MVYIVIALLLIILILTARLISLHHEISRVSKSLYELNTGVTGQKLTITMLHRPLETLCQQINLEITDRDKARIAVENHEAELRAQISNISHDLRTPLTSILGYISMAKASPEKVADYLETIEGRSKALQSLIEQFYELSVIEDSRNEMILKPVDATAILTNCLLDSYTLFEKKGIEPETCLPNQSIIIINNAEALERIFQNLLQNALKFAEYNVTISLADEGEYCAFVISNDASNLTESDIEHLFERFYVADKSRKTNNTGLGLYIVKRLLEKTRSKISEVSFSDKLFTIQIRFEKSK